MEINPLLLPLQIALRKAAGKAFGDGDDTAAEAFKSAMADVQTLSDALPELPAPRTRTVKPKTPPAA